MKELFEEYRSNVKLLKRQLEQLDSMQMLTDTVRGSSAEWPYTQHSMTVCGRNAVQETALRKDIDMLRHKVQRVDDVLRKTPNGKIRLILVLRYVDGLKWDEVASEIEENVSGDAIRKRAEAWFDSLKVSSDFSDIS